jgi:hypothetical protein
MAANLQVIVLRLQGAEAGERASAAAALAEQALDDASLRQPIVAAGALPLLVALLRSAAAQAHAADALAALAMNEAIRQPIVAAGALPTLVKLLRAGIAVSKANAAKAIGWLARDAHARTLIVDEGALTPLVDMVRSGSEGGTTHAAHHAMYCIVVDESPITLGKSYAARALAELAQDAPTRTLIADRGAVPALVALMRSGSAEGKTNAARAVGWLAQDAPTRALIAGDGALPLLVGLMRTGSERSQMNAAAAIYWLALDEPLRSRIVDEGALPALIALVSPRRACSDKSAGQIACLALHRLAADARMRELAEEHGVAGALSAAAHAPDCEWAVQASATLRELWPEHGDAERALGTRPSRRTSLSRTSLSVPIAKRSGTRSPSPSQRCLLLP